MRGENSEMKITRTENGRRDVQPRLSHRPNYLNINGEVVHKAGARQLLA
jgi:hypothetical protein